MLDGYTVGFEDRSNLGDDMRHVTDTAIPAD